MNLPNKLTILRVLMIPFFVFFMLVDFGYPGRIAALVLFCAASFTDFLDGFIARKYHLVTNFGKFMDPLADKLLVCSALICFVGKGELAAWIVIIIMAREFIISGFRLVASDNGVVIAANMWGKLKTVSQMIMIILIILDLEALCVLKNIFTYLALALTVISLEEYIRQNIRVLKEGEV
ncbi:CDP-diacylglycerol--glycerol-3-phosphate 3-phosphatidyltransferase [Fusibacillus kribbianus]|uniref:CDP-diacylglycerol--glycerol-3-phosphate 3-phosphatidyltransferase n=1 Tax=Fusibacillus kribbianus TaxID=3044208 RepID=A0AAP4F0D7_9FIRM|nr:CDP-diacylglycerol--glycerol-3-phosphate 3-phosphatidyltransferase [Ruminococcus sp. YH-rum2234]MDI9241693.1 CDP-diacylglycerol--glycerol-3-phosphate 3-phosphatidyltransferase [Ruminococcus sp. YH-rum2234]